MVGEREGVESVDEAGDSSRFDTKGGAGFTEVMRGGGDRLRGAVVSEGDEMDSIGRVIGEA